MRGRLNLASQRFRNERFAALVFAVGCVALLGTTAEHARLIRRLLPGQSSALHREVASLEQEVARLRRESTELRSGGQPEKAKVEEWQLVKDLVDRRVFRWTQLFARLADTLRDHDDVRLTAIAPTVTKGRVTLDVDAAVKSLDSGLAFIRQLEERPEFENVYPKGVNSNPRSEEQEFKYTMEYVAEAPGDAPAATPAKGAGQ